MSEDKQSNEKEIGKIIHYFTNISVGAIKLTDNLSVGDTIHIKGNTTDFYQKIESIQIEHKNIEKAQKGQEVGLKTDEKVREGDIVYKVEE